MIAINIMLPFTHQKKKKKRRSRCRARHVELFGEAFCFRRKERSSGKDRIRSQVYEEA